MSSKIERSMINRAIRNHGECYIYTDEFGVEKIIRPNQIKKITGHIGPIHTEEPWQANHFQIVAMNDKRTQIAHCGGGGCDVDTSLANAARIVACVNALAGIENVQAFVDAAKQAAEQYDTCEDAKCLHSLCSKIAAADKP